MDLNPFPDYLAEGGIKSAGMDDLINQIKQGGVKLKSTRPLGSVGKKASEGEVVAKEKPADAVQEMKSILATMKRGRHGRLKPSAISQELKSRSTKTKKKEKRESVEEKEDSQIADETVGVSNGVHSNADMDTPTTVRKEGTESTTTVTLRKERSPFSTVTTLQKECSPERKENCEEEISYSKSKDKDPPRLSKSVYDSEESTNSSYNGMGVHESTPTPDPTPEKNITTANASYTLKLSNSCFVEDNSSREATPPAPSMRKSEERASVGSEEEGSSTSSLRPSPPRAVTSTTIFLRTSRSPSQE